jgi:hypothetical protein
VAATSGGRLPDSQPVSGPAEHGKVLLHQDQVCFFVGPCWYIIVPLLAF